MFSDCFPHFERTPLKQLTYNGITGHTFSTEEEVAHTQKKETMKIARLYFSTEKNYTQTSVAKQKSHQNKMV